jgi:hypothetical protein
MTPLVSSLEIYPTNLKKLFWLMPMDDSVSILTLTHGQHQLMEVAPTLT